ncbi:MAG: DEAD/DEAH box helicase family protein, partial [Mailhella sp.]|nr:DEAD/DEAH box helicase family protein [Mailhella sp.]
MKLQFKHQNFQEEAARAVLDVFAGQGYLTSDYLIDPGKGGQTTLLKGWRNEPLTPYMTGDRLKSNLHAVQKRNGLPLSDKLEGPGVNLTIEMETGTGKTYTYIKTMYELNRAYGWSKFIVVVPSVAIREGVAKSFAVMEEHFAEEYGKKIRHFIYNSTKLNDIRQFAESNSIQVMIINSQSFTSKEKNLIHQSPDSFQSRSPIEVIAKTRPILIIDEPQSVEGPQTKARLKDFNGFLTLRYSATHKEDYNMVYRLDALDAYNQKLVKKIAVKGIRASGDSGTGGFVYLQSINLSKGAPTASIEHDIKTKSGVKKKVSVFGEGDDLYHASEKLDEYKSGFTITRISGVDNSVEFVNGLKLFCGDAVGEIGEEVRSEIQIRETIQSHLEREEELFDKGIKVLSLFFIDEVAKYRQYDAAGQASGGVYAQSFEEIYEEEVAKKKDGSLYGRYLASITASSTHAGYFSVDKKGRMIDSKVKDKKERTSEDVDAYDLIMKNKELLLDRDPVRSPVRFIFSHSALREGWDNPNVFQICTLKKSGSDVRRRQEVGRGMRLCVNQYGERMDENVLSGDVHAVNKLTVIASESYEDFARGLQSEMAEAIKGRPVAVTPELFEGRTITSSSGETWKVDEKTARAIYKQLAFNDYLDDDDKLTDVFYEHKSSGEFILGKGLEEYSASICSILDSVYNGNALKPENARDVNVEAKLNQEKLESPEFKELWSLISPQTVYKVDFD